MRLWTLHPDYLDSKGIVALWREALGAQRNILGLVGIEPKAKGYNHHPQLTRFMMQPAPILLIQHYLWNIYISAKKRGYDFDKQKIYNLDGLKLQPIIRSIPVNMGQVVYEACLLNNKIKERKGHSSLRFLNINIKRINIELIVNPIFCIVPNWKPEPWEKVRDDI